MVLMGGPHDAGVRAAGSVAAGADVEKGDGGGGVIEEGGGRLRWRFLVYPGNCMERDQVCLCMSHVLPRQLVAP